MSSKKSHRKAMMLDNFNIWLNLRADNGRLIKIRIWFDGLTETEENRIRNEYFEEVGRNIYRAIEPTLDVTPDDDLVFRRLEKEPE